MLSISQLKTFGCPKKYQYKYIDKIPEKKTPPLVCGGLLDYSLQELYYNDYDLEIVRNKAAEYIEKHQHEIEAVEWPADNGRFSARKSMTFFCGYMLDTLLPAYIERADVLKPAVLNDGKLALQVKVSTEITDLTEIGYIDMISGPDADILVDFKTAAQAPAREEWEDDPQLIYYYHGFSEFFNRPAQKVIYEFLILNKTPKFERFEFEITQEQVNLLIDDFKTTEYLIAQGVFPRNRGNCFDYGRRCDYYEKCFNKNVVF